MADDFQQKSDALVEWFLNDPYASMSRKVKIADLRSTGRGRGIIAVGDLMEGEEIFRIPLSKTLSVETSELTKKLSPSDMEDIEEWTMQVLVLMYEYLQGSQSIWGPYLNLLPHTFETLIFWSDDELEQLQGSSIKGKIGKEEADSVFRETLVPLILSNTEVFFSSCATLLQEEELLHLAHQMASTVLAYGFDLERPASRITADENGFATEADLSMRAMVPMADMLNAEADNNTQLFQDEPQYLSMSAIRAIKIGEELLNDYGQLPRSELLRRYGYIHNSYRQFDSVELSHLLLAKSLQKRLSISDHNLRRVLDKYEDRDELEDEYLVTYPIDASRCLPDDLLAFVEVLVKNTDDYELSGPDDKSEQQVRLTVHAGQVLQQALEDKQAEYQTTLAEDAAILQGTLITPRMRLAVEVRYGEKQVINEALVECKRMQDIKGVVEAGKLGMKPLKRRKLG